MFLHSIRSLETIHSGFLVKLTALECLIITFTQQLVFTLTGFRLHSLSQVHHEPEDANASMLGKQDIASFCSGIDRIVRTSTLAPVVVSPDRRRALMGDVVKFKMCEELLPLYVGLQGLLQGDGGRQSAAACMRYLVGVTKATHSWVRH
jgi:hypothetical protein